ncbi:MAG: SUMF1/EgtB/PvdO family nonheme iron enzyme [Flavobacteriaceae bacterium]|nr:SUMF1/EgtB/PvdO family nonheme iron enzyme [Flavobacteriaceae bacterium]
MKSMSKWALVLMGVLVLSQCKREDGVSNKQQPTPPNTEQPTPPKDNTPTPPSGETPTPPNTGEPTPPNTGQPTPPSGETPTPPNTGQPVSNDPANIEKIFVEGGSFKMGSPDGEGEENERPQHNVTLKSFYISKYEITNAQFAEFLNKGRFQGRVYNGLDIEYKDGKWVPGKNKGNLPVVNVPWHGANAYAEWAGGRLPTEAEWEYAARGGKKSEGFIYSGSNNPDDVAWHLGNSQSSAQPVGTKKANELGIHDMSGNVLEWTSDFYAPYPSEDQHNPEGPNTGYSRVYRGGSFRNTSALSRVARRFHFSHNYTIGFRVAFSENKK